MTLRQNGDDKGALSFDPANQEQAKAAILAVKVRRKEAAFGVAPGNFETSRQIVSTISKKGVQPVETTAATSAL
jgi:hypothetical protein